MIPQVLIAAVAAHFGLQVETLRSRSRRRYVSEARGAAAWVLRHAFPALGLVDIGELLGRDHTTIIFSLKAQQARMDTDPDLERDLLALIARYRQSAPPVRPEDDRRFWSVKIVSAA